MKHFETAARRSANSPVSNPVDITFMFDEHEMTAHPPSTGQVALFTARQLDGGIAGVRAMLDFLAQVLGDDDFKILEQALEEGLDILLINEILSYLIEEWSARPTSPSSASSTSRNGTGRRSTAKRAARASTT